MLPPLLLIPLVRLAETLATVAVTTIAARFASDVYDAAKSHSTTLAVPSAKEDAS